MTQLQAIDQPAEQEFDPKIYLQILKRRIWWLVIPTVVVFGAVFWVALALPPIYTATASILVESQQIPSALAQSTVTANADERLQIIQQRLMTRDNLLATAKKYALYANQNLSPSDVVDQMRKAAIIRRIDVGSNSASRPGLDAIGFTISFENEDPASAAKVANEFVTSILEQNIQARTSRAAETSKFFDQNVTQLEKDLAATEARIVDFKNKNQASLPETLSSRTSLLTQLQGQASDLRGRISSLQSQRQFLEGQDGPALAAGDNSTEAQLAQLRSQLVQLRALYSDNHPDVRAVAAKIAALEKASSAPPPVAPDAKATKPAPVSSLNAARIADIDNQIATLNKQLADVEQRAALIDQSIQKTPEVEVALNVLMRDYDSLQSQYKNAQVKAADASTGQQLEEDRQAERFSVLESASAPTLPTRPDRKRILFAGGFGAIAAGLGIAMLTEFMDQSVRTAADLEKKLRLRPISSIPFIDTNAERQRRKFRRIGIPLGVLLSVFAALISVQLFYLPLTLVVQKMVARLML